MPSDFFQETFLYTDNEVPLSVFESFFGIGNEGLYLHCHDCMELMYVQKGSGTIYVDFQEYTVTAGDFILIAPGQLHSGNRAPHEQLYCQAIVFDLNELKEGKIDYIYKNFIYKFFDHQITPPTLIQKTQSFYDDLARDFFSIYDEYAQKKEAYECFIKSSLFHLLGTLYRNSEKHFTVNQEHNHNIEKIKIALQYILQNYDQNISVDDLASVTGYSKYYFMHFFKNITGLTVTQYINMVRLDKAAQLLLNNDYSITEVCSKVGYTNLSYFIKQFTSRYKKTPNKFRS